MKPSFTAAWPTIAAVEIEKVEAEQIEKFGAEKILKGLGGILVPGGFGERGIEGKIQAAQYAREQKVPYLGLCLGMQIATIEFARNVLKLEGAHSTEFDPNTPHPVIALLDEQKNDHRQRRHDAPGPPALPIGRRVSQANRLYGAFIINERHRHRYEFNNDYRDAFAKAGFVFSGRVAGRQIGGSDRIARAIHFSWPASFTRNFRANPTSRIRCSKASSPPPTCDCTKSRCDESGLK